MLRRVILILAVAVMACFVLILLFIHSPYDWYLLSGSSMEPVLLDGDIMLVRLSPENWNKGDVVLFQPEGSEWTHVKRIAAVPGDQVEADQTGLYVNDQRMIPSPQPPLGPIQIPDRHVFVLGDRPENSSDSRDFGPVPFERLEARVDAVIYPIFRIARISGEKEEGK
jgi:signal peptidase I